MAAKRERNGAAYRPISKRQQQVVVPQMPPKSVKEEHPKGECGCQDCSGG